MLLTKDNETYWSLVVEPGWVQAAIWKADKSAKTANVIATSQPAHWEEEEDLISAADSCLSAAVQDLPEDHEEPHKTVFGVPPSWVEGGQIKEGFLGKIRHLSEKLSLEPAGFVVLPEALSFYTKAEEGAPLNAVVVGVYPESLDIALFRLGHLTGVVSVARSVSIVDDVVEGLARFGAAEPFPSRFLVYDGKEAELEEAKQALIAADWSGEFKEKISFLHTPQVEIVDVTKKILAVSLAGASEIGGALNLEASQSKAEGEGTARSTPAIKEEETNVVGAAALGFSSEGEPPQRAVGSRRIALKLPALNMSRPFAIFKRFEGLMKQRKLLPFALFGGGLFVVALALAWWFLPTATVTLFIEPKKLEETLSVTVDSDVGGANFEARILPGKVSSASVSGEKTRSTTGTITVGEKAKGRVTLRNGTGSAIKLSAGTLLSGANNLNFTLDSAVTVPAKPDIATLGTAIADVTAEKIGAEYNLAKGESLKVANYPKLDIDAVVEGDLSGGSSREISAVSTEDREALEASLKEELLEKGKNEIEGELTDGEVLIAEALEATASGRDFSHKVGDQASTLKLSMDLKVAGPVVQKQDLVGLAERELKDKIPQGFVLRPEQIEFTFELTDQEDGKWVINVNFVVNLLPEVNPDEIAKKIAGKSAEVARKYLVEIAGFTRAEIRINPKLPGIFGTLPHLSRRITVEVAAEK